MAQKNQLLYRVLFNGAGRVVAGLAAAVGFGVVGAVLVAVPLTVGFAGVRLMDVAGFGLTSPLGVANE